MHLTSVVALGSIALLFTTSIQALELHVSPTGNDSNPGTKAKPLASLEGARDAVRKVHSAREGDREPITILFAGGTYPVTHETLFGPDDSGSAQQPITYKAAPGEVPVFDGGRRIANWKKHDADLWVAELSEVAQGKWNFHELFVNGARRPRARIPNQGFLRVAGCPEGTPKTANYHKDCQSFQFSPGDIRPDWRNLRDVEVIVYHFWTDSHLPIASVDTVSNVVTFAHKAGKVFTDDFSEDGARYIVENVFEGLDAPGEWYLDRPKGLLFYRPVAGEDMAKVEVVAPVSPAHVRLEGSLPERRYVEHLKFQNLTFKHSRFELPPGNSNDQQGSASVPAAITLRAARWCTFSNCKLTELGTFAFDAGPACVENEFSANEIGPIAAGGFRLNGGNERGAPWERNRNNRITDNWLHEYGVVYPSAVGILLMNTEGNTVCHNHIERGSYTGVSIGWVWGYQRSVSQQNRIEYNHIHHIGGVLSDMGGIYTLGVSPGTTIRNNHIHDVDANRYGGWGIYHDEGSTHLLVESNVVHHTKFAGFNIHFAKEVTARNNIFALGKLEQVSRTRHEPHKSVYFENNIVFWREGELFSKDWKDVPYTFYFHPKNSAGTATVTNTFDCDWNLYFNPSAPIDEVKWANASWAEWQKRGKDAHSRYADPHFKNSEAGDFTLAEDSPAFALGFQPIELRNVGPRVKTGPAVK